MRLELNLTGVMRFHRRFTSRNSLLMTLFTKYLVNFLGNFLKGSILRLLASLLTKLLKDNIFLNGPVFKCPFTKSVSINNFLNKLTTTL